MHLSSKKEMKNFVEKYLDKEVCLKILDVGSRDGGNGNYKDLFNFDNWIYEGLDVEHGNNVNIISNNLYKWPIEDESYDIVISGQCLEHVKDIYSWITEIKRIIKPGGLTCIIAPWIAYEHKYPVDCWRILPDGMRYIVEEWSGLQVLECYDREGFTFCAARKP